MKLKDVNHLIHLVGKYHMAFGTSDWFDTTHFDHKQPISLDTFAISGVKFNLIGLVAAEHAMNRDGYIWIPDLPWCAINPWVDSVGGCNDKVAFARQFDIPVMFARWLVSPTSDSAENFHFDGRWTTDKNARAVLAKLFKLRRFLRWVPCGNRLLYLAYETVAMKSLTFKIVRRFGLI